MRSKVADFQRAAAPAVQARDEAWYLEQLHRVCPEVYTKGKDHLIICPFHADSSPSCGVDRYGGFFKCFACGAGGGWNKLADRLGMEKLKFEREAGRIGDAGIQHASDDTVRALTKMGVDPAKREKKGDINQPLVETWPVTREWRGLTGASLANVGCIRVLDLRHNVERIGLPVRAPMGDVLGYTCRAITPEDAEPKYTPLAADRVTWRDKELPARDALFLVDRVLKENWDRIVLVEGPYDALKLYCVGIPAVAILGTNNWTAQKAGSIKGLGLRGVAVMMDNDRSGAEAQLQILHDLSTAMKVTSLRLPPGCKDPGDLSPKQLAWVKGRLDNL